MRPGLIKMAFGEVLKPVAIERFRGTEGGIHFVSVIDTDLIQGARTHFLDGFGYFYCTGGVCCQELGFPATRYILPVVEYTTIDPQKLVFGGPVSVKYIPRSKDQYEELMVKHQLCGDIGNVDMLVRCTDAKMQKLTLDIATTEATWRKDPEMVATVNEAMKEYDRLIEMSIARSLPEDKIIAAITEKQGPVENPLLAQVAAGQRTLQHNSGRAVQATPQIASKPEVQESKTGTVTSTVDMEIPPLGDGDSPVDLTKASETQDALNNSDLDLDDLLDDSEG